jgi:prolyl oligopeptidase
MGIHTIIGAILAGRTTEANVNRALAPATIGMVALLALAAAVGAQGEGGGKCPPAARVDGVKDTYGSTVVVDPYRWLEDQQSAETRAWIAAQQKCTEAALGKLLTRTAIAKRLTELFRTDRVGTPTERNGRYFFSKRMAGEDLGKLYVRKSPDGSDELLVDPLPWSADHSASATLEGISRDGRVLFYGRRDGGQDEITLHAMEVETRKELQDSFPKAEFFSVEPTADGRAVYYVRRTESGPRAYYHQMGTDSAKDALLFGEKLDKDKILVSQLTDDGNFLIHLVLYGSGTERSEIYAQNVKESSAAFAVVNDQNALFYPETGGEQLFVLTNWKAPQWRVFSVDLAKPSPEQWKEVIPETKVHLEALRAAAGKLVAVYTQNASSKVQVFDADGKNGRVMELPSLGSVTVGRGRWDSKEIFYDFDGFSAPSTIYRYEARTGKSETWWQPNVPLDAQQFQTEQVWYESKDKTRVPMFLFYKKGKKRDGNAPVLLTAYGGFDVSLTPSFDPSALVWAERGGIVATANLRGGGEFGEDWHRAGMFEKKQTVFDDFIAAAEYLIREKYTSAGKLAIVGGSNGGLLMGAMMTQRPDLFRAVVCAYPLLDMLRFQKFLSGPYWVSEYGSSDDLKQFAYIYAYSPYHHVENGKKYPSVLFVTGDGDTRVAPLHARKMAARMQAAARSQHDRPVLLLYDTKSGHSGGRPVNKQIEEATDVLSYCFWQLGVE